jgi:hypothetical protein
VVLSKRLVRIMILNKDYFHNPCRKSGIARKPRGTAGDKQARQGRSGG